MKCVDVQKYYQQYWQMNDDDPMRIEIEAHLLDCEFCASQLHIVLDDTDYTQDPFYEPIITKHEIDYVNRQVMDRIYAEETWYIPVASKRSFFSKAFRRNTAIIVASCMAMFSIALYFFIFDYPKQNKEQPSTTVSGIVEVANAASDSDIKSAIYMSEIPTASIIEPIVLKAVPAFPQYYIGLSLLGFVLTLILVNWLTRVRN